MKSWKHLGGGDGDGRMLPSSNDLITFREQLRPITV